MVTVFYFVGIAVVWVLAWGSLSVANVVAGVLIAAVLLVVSPEGLGRPGSSSRPPIRPLAAARFFGFVGFDLLRSNLILARQIVARNSGLHAGVMAVPLPQCSDALLTLIANVLALTPGTNPIHVSRDPSMIFVHVLRMHDVDASRAEVYHLADLAFRAFSPKPLAVQSILDDVRAGRLQIPELT